MMKCSCSIIQQLIVDGMGMNSCVQEGVSRMAELEAQTRKMAQELAEYKSESTELRNQDHTVRRLEERVRSLEAELQEKVQPAMCLLVQSSALACRTYLLMVK